MNTTESNDFGRLYRAAFAEREPGRKVFLLKQVQDVINQWGQQHTELPLPRPGTIREDIARQTA